MRLAIVALLVVAVAPSRASAMCAPVWWVGAPPSGTLPGKGSVYIRTDHPGHSGYHQVSPTVMRLDFDKSQGSTVSIHGPFDTTRMALDDSWRAPTAHPRVVAIYHFESEWTCGSTDAITIEIDEAVTAFRVRWTSGGRTTELVEVAKNDNATSRVSLGRMSCSGTSIPPEELHAGGTLELTAIRFDGSEVPVEGVPARIKVDPKPRQQLDDGWRASHHTYYDEPGPEVVDDDGLDTFGAVVGLVLLLFAPFAVPLAPVIGRRARLTTARVVPR